MGVLDRYNEKKKKKEEESKSKTTSGGVAERYERNKYYQTLDTDSVDDNYINSFMSDTNNFFSGVNDKSISYDAAKSTLGDLSTRYDTIQGWLYKNKSKLNEEAYTSLSSTFDGIKTSFDGIKDFYSQWDSDEDYQTSLRQDGYKQKYSGMSWEDVQSALNTLEDGEEKEWLSTYQYELLPTAADFDNKSTAGWEKYLADQEAKKQAQQEAREDESFWDKLGRWLGPTGAVDTSIPLGNAPEITHNLSKDTSYLKPKDNWTEDQKAVYGYLYDSGGEAANYAKLTNEGNNQAENAEKIAAIEAWATQNGLTMAASTLGAIATMPLSLADTLSALTEYNARGFVSTSAAPLPGQVSNAITGAISSTLNGVDEEGVAHNVLDENIPVVGGKGWGDAYQLGTSIANSILTANTQGPLGTYLVFFGSASSSGMYDAKRRGATDEQAITLGVLNGLAEAAGEAFSAEKLLSLAGVKELKSFFANLLMQAGIEASEEGVTTLLNTFADKWVMKDKSNYSVTVSYYMNEKGMSREEAEKQANKDWLNDIAFDILGGAISGFSSAGLQTGVQTMFVNHAENKRAQKIYGTDPGALVNEALEIDPDNAFAQKMQGRLDSGKNLSGGQLNRLVQQNEKALTAQDMYSIQSAAESRLAELGETGDVSAIASALTKQAAGEKLSRAEQKAIANSKYGQRVANELNTDNIGTGDYSSAWAENIGTEKINAEEYSRLVEAAQLPQETAEVAGDQVATEAPKMAQTPKASPVGSAAATVGENRTVETAPEGNYEVSADGKTIDKKGNIINVVGVESVKDGKMILKTEDGTISSDDVVYATKDDALIYEAVAKMDASPAASWAMIKGFQNSKGVSAETYASAFPLAYLYGKINYEKGVLVDGKPKLGLTLRQSSAAFQMGRNDAAAAVKTSAQASTESTVTEKNLDKKIIFEGFNRKEQRAIKPAQKASMAAIDMINKVTSLEVHVYKSYEKNGKLYAIVNGKERLAPNGYFTDGNKVYIDINAGQMKEGLMLYTLSHEVGHYIARWNAQDFKAISDFLFEHYGEDVPIYDLLDAQKNKLKKSYELDGEPLPSNAVLDKLAHEELVCDMLSRMLADKNAYDTLMELKQKDLNVFQKLGQAIKKILDKISKAIGFYDTKSPDFQVAASVETFGEEAFRQLQDLYIRAFVQADANYQAAEAMGIEIDKKTESVSPAVMNSERTWTESDYVQEREQAAKEIAKAIGVSVKKAKAYIDSVNSIAKMIAEDRVRLDYFSSPGRSSFVGNVEYGGSFDFSTLCKKRRLLTGTFTAIQKALPNTALTANEILDIRNRMKDAGLEVSCGLCYVEGSRANMGQFAKEFLKLYKQYYPDAWQPNMADVNTPDGIEWVRINHPECYEQYEYFWNHYGTLKPGDKNLFASQQKPKLYQLHTEYKGEILDKFNDDDNVEEKNLNGGIRLQSFSDFEIVHLIDTMQIIMDMSRVGLAGQAYTKVPDFAWALGDTGLKINLSLIAKGVDENGKLVFDDVEGMPIDTAVALRNRYSKNVGTILVAFNDEQLLAAMADDRVDFIIPFHRSQWKKSQYEAMGLPAKTKDYTYMQNEKFIKPQYHEYRGRMVKDKATNYMPNEYWDFSKSGKENAESYLEMCARNNKRPKFYKLLQNNGDGSYSLKADGSTDGYWKLLIDFKMYDNDGNGSPQLPVKPEFNMEEATRMLDEYSGGHSNFPVAQGVVDSFVKEYKDSHKGVQHSDRDESSTSYGRNKVVDNSALDDKNSITNTTSRGDNGDNRGVRTGVAETGFDRRGNSENIRDAQTSQEWGNQASTVQRVVKKTVKTHINQSENAAELYYLLCAYVGKSDYEMTPYFYNKAVGILAERLFNDAVTLHPVVFENKWSIFGGKVSDIYYNIKDAAVENANSTDGHTLYSDRDQNQQELVTYKDALNNLSEYSDSDLRSIAEQVTDGTYSFAKNMPRESMENVLRSTLAILLKDSPDATITLSAKESKSRTEESDFMSREDRKLFLALKSIAAMEGYEVSDDGNDVDDAETTHTDDWLLSDGEFLFQDRTEDSVSNRSLLANAFEGLAQNEIERNKIQEYRSKVELINAEERKLSELNAQIKKLSFSQGPRDTKKIKSLQFEANKAANRINTYDKQLLRLEASKPLQDVLAREKKKAYKKAEQRGKDALAAYKEKTSKTQRELLDKWQESRKKGIESREKTAMRHKIQSVVGELNQLLLSNDKKRHVPDSLKKAVADSLALVNMDTVGAEERAAKYAALIAKETDPDKIDAYTVTMENILRQGDKMGQRLKDLRDAYEEIQNSDDPDIANAYDPAIAGSLKELAGSIGNTSLRDMSIEQLQDVYSMYKMVLTRVRDANKSFLNAKKESISNLASRVVGEVRNAGGEHKYRAAILDFVKKFGWDNLKPVYAFEHLGSGTLTAAFNSVRAGEDVWAVDVTEAREYYLDKSKKYGYDSWDFKKKYRFKSASEIEFDLTLEQILSLYAYSKREQAHDHLRLGGFVFDSNIETYKENGSKLIKYKVNTADAHQITPDILANIIGNLTQEQMSFVDEMQEYLSTVMGAKGNEVTMAMYGVKLFKEKFYFPLKSAKQFMFEQNEVSGEVRIKNSGFTNKVVAKANNPVILNNFMDVWAGHVNDMSMYHAFVLPLEDFNRIFNYNSPKQEGKPSVSVKGTIQNAYGPSAVGYVRQLITDLNGGARSDSTTGIINKMIGLFKKGSVFASLSVVVQQPSAIARAAALVDTKYFIGPKVDHKRHKALWEEVKQYAPVAIIKEMGYFDTNMGKSTQDFIQGKEYSGFKEKMKALVVDSDYRDELLSKAPALADEIAWCGIWEAVKRETKAKNPSMDVKSEEFLKMVGERFTEVVTKTQVYDSVLSRSGLMRSKDTGMKMATAFMAEPTTSINMVADALLQGKRGNKKYARAAIGAVIASQIINSILVSFVYAGRDDDEDETYWEKYIGTLSGETLDSLNPAVYIPFIKDIMSIVQGYDVERSDMSVVSDLWKSIENLSKDNVSAYRKVEGFAGSISQIFGLPVKNIMRDARGIYQTIMSFVNGQQTTAAGIWYAVKGAITGKDTSDTEQLYEAYLSGDATQIARVKGRFKDHSAVNTAIRKAIKDHYEAGDINLATAEQYLVKFGGMDKDDAYWKVGEWEYETDTGEEFQKYNNFYTSVQTGKNLKAVIKEYTDNGVESKTLASQITSHFKPLYQKMSNAERAAIKGYLLNAYALLGYDRSKKSKDIDKWLED